MPLFHHSDTAHLPFILSAGELQPSKNRVGNYPEPDFVWATSSPDGDGTSTLMMSKAGRDAHRDNVVLRVRIELPQAEFFHWSQVEELYPQWTAEQRAKLETRAAGVSDPKLWWCRDGYLPVTEATPIFVKDWRSPWRRVMFERIYEQD